MHPSNQENLSARRFDSSRYDAGYDCELPDDVRAQLEKSPRNLNERRSEFARAKRPRMLERPLQEPPNRGGVLKLAAAVAIPALNLVCVISSWQRERTTPERTKTNQAILQPLAPQPPPTPGPTVSRGAIAPEGLFHTAKTAAPRAMLLKLPPPKAQLIRLPDLPPAPRAIRILQRAREARVRDLHALNRELREVLRRVEPGPPST
jgi:hypothetical protein